MNDELDAKSPAKAEAEVEHHDVGSTTDAPTAPPGAMQMDIEIGEDGEGSAMIGLDVDRCALWNPPTGCSVGVMAAHTVGISRVFVSDAKPGSTVHVVVLPK